MNTKPGRLSLQVLEPRQHLRPEGPRSITNHLTPTKHSASIPLGNTFLIRHNDLVVPMSDSSTPNVTGVTQARAVHLTDLRRALDDVSSPPG